MPRLLRLARSSSDADYRLRSARLAAAAVIGGAAVALLRPRRLEVSGHSMLPTLEPGDRLLVRRSRRARTGDLVVVPDPRLPSRLVVKRVVDVSSAGLTVEGDNAVASTDSRQFGPVRRGSVRGRVVYRYFPDQRRGRIRRVGTLKVHGDH